MVFRLVLLLSLSILIVSLDISDNRTIKSKGGKIPNNNEKSVCNFPKVNPFDEYYFIFPKTNPKIVCPGISWVKCHYSKCRVMTEMLKNINNIKCGYRDLIYYHDFDYVTTEPKILKPRIQYKLRRSDFVKVFCRGVKKENRYRTAFYEDHYGGTFQYASYYFNEQPADHYPLPYLYEAFHRNPVFPDDNREFCIGDTPRYKILMNLTRQFIDLDGKRFVFTFISDISHDNFERISTADDDFADFLRSLLNSERRNDTLIIVMGDHGIRFEKFRNTYMGNVDEKLPILAIRLPDRLKKNRPDAQQNLQSNSEVLTTVHDLHSTILDVAGLKKHWSNYTVPGASYTRALTLLKPIPRDRSCVEADISAHYCVCLTWSSVATNHSVIVQMVDFFVQFINRLTEPHRSDCAKRSLVAVEWAQISTSGSRLQKIDLEIYKIKVVLNPAQAKFEATITHATKEQKFEVQSREISRVDRYGKQADCIYKKMPSLAKFCYCQNTSPPTEG